MASSSPTPPNPPYDPSAPEPRRPRALLKWIAAAVLLVLVIVGLWPSAQPVELGAVMRGTLQVTVDEEGVTQVRHRYVIAAPVSGHLRRIPWEPGAAVLAGETVVAELEPGGSDLLDPRSQAQAEARVRAAESSRDAADAQLARARAARELAEAEAGRREQLARRGLLAAAELESAQTTAETARQDERAAAFAAEVARHEVEQARAVLLRSGPGTRDEQSVLPVRSPVSGRVLRVFEESARTVPAGLPLLEVGDPTDLEIRIELLSRHAVRVAPGAPVLLDQWGGAEPLQARVRWVEPSAFTKISALGVEEQRVNVIADLLTPQEQRPGLGDNFRVEARVVVAVREAVLQVPAGALFQQDGEWRTFVADGGRARRRTVKVGATNGIQTEVLSGIEEGDAVIVYPGDQVRDGTRVRAR